MTTALVVRIWSLLFAAAVGVAPPAMVIRRPAAVAASPGASQMPGTEGMVGASVSSIATAAQLASRFGGQAPVAPVRVDWKASESALVDMLGSTPATLANEAQETQLGRQHLSQPSSARASTPASPTCALSLGVSLMAASILIFRAMAARMRSAAMSKEGQPSVDLEMTGRTDAAWSEKFAVAALGGEIGHAVIMQNKGGGHGEIGYHLALALKARGLKVTLLQDSAAKKSIVPYSLYDTQLPDTDIVWVDPGDKVSLAQAAADAVKDGPPITHIFENRAKEPADIAELLAMAKASPVFKMFAFVSSAGMYTAKGELVETGEVKDPPTGQRLVELELARELPGKWCSFRPQYIYGPYTNKRGYLDWFLQRAAQELPMGVPGDASQPVNLAHCEDVAELLSSVVGKEAEAGGEIFNCGTTEQVTYQAVCDAAAQAMGKRAKIVFLPAGTKTSFPFRPNAEGFYVNANKAKSKLGWLGPKHNVLEDIAAGGFYTADFKSLGLDKADVDVSKDMDLDKLGIVF